MCMMSPLVADSIRRDSTPPSLSFVEDKDEA